MSSRSPIQVPEDLKVEIDGLKDEFRAKTHYEVIDRLIRFRQQAQRDLQIAADKKYAEQQRQKDEDIHLGADLKEQFGFLADKLGLRSPSEVVQLLMHHYEHSSSMSKDTFEFYTQLRK